MLQNILTSTLLLMLLHLVNCNLVQIHNSLTLSYIHGIQIGYPMINELGTICQTPPYTYISIPIGAVPEIVGTLRSPNGTAVGLWYNTKQCFVTPFSSSNDCTSYTFSNRLSECDNDIRLQLNAGNTGFKVVQDLNDIQALTESMFGSIYQLEALNKRSVILMKDARSALLSQMYNVINSLVVQIRTFLSKIGSYIIKDTAFGVSSMNNPSIENFCFQQYSVANLTVAQFNLTRIEVMKASVLLDIDRSISFLSTRNTTSSMRRLHLKQTGYHMICLIVLDIFSQVGSFNRAATDCSRDNCGVVALTEPLINNQLLTRLQNFSFSESDVCIQSLVSNVEDMFQLAKHETEHLNIDFSMPFKWHRCLSQSDLSVHRSFSLEFPLDSIPYALTVSVVSEEGHPGQVFLPRTVLTKFYNAKTRVLDLKELYTTALTESNADIVENIDVPNPTPESIPPPSVEPLFKCPPGRYGKDCISCPVGTWSNDGYLHLCSNAPIDRAEYFVSNWPTPDCPFRCLNDHYRVNNSCQVPPDGLYPLDSSYLLAHCRSKYPLQFLSFVSPGAAFKPFSCTSKVHHALEVEYDVSTILTGSFTIELWMSVRVPDLLNVCGGNCNDTRFGIVDAPGIWSLYMSVVDSSVALCITDKIGESVVSNLFSLDDNWHQFAFQYDSRLRLVSFSVDSVIVGTGWYSPPLDAKGDSLIIGGIRSDYPVKTRILPGKLAKVYIHPVVLPMEAFSANVNTVRKICTADEQWDNHKCISRCSFGASRSSTGECSCTWGAYFNNETRECSWCPMMTLGSSFPFLSERDCICAPGYIWSEVTHSCIIGKTSLEEPIVELMYDPVPFLEMLDTTQGTQVPVNTTLRIRPPSQNSVSRTRSLVDSTKDIVLDVVILSGLSVLVRKQVSFLNLPFQYTLISSGQYRIEASFNALGHLPGQRFSQAILIRDRLLPPFVLPSDSRLNGTTLLKIGSLERSEHVIHYSFGDDSFKIYDKLNPPIVTPPISIYTYTKSSSLSILPSTMTKISYVWNTESEEYQLFSLYGNAADSPSNTSDTKVSNTLTFLSWCQRGIPNCIIVFVVPVVLVILIFVGVLLSIILVTLAVKRRKRERFRSPQANIKKSKSPRPPSSIEMDRARHSTRSYGDILCGTDSCSKLARCFCWDCTTYLCKTCQKKHGEESHQLVRVMICDICGRKASTLVRLKVSHKHEKQLCHFCLLETPNKGHKSLTLQTICACSQCNDEEVDTTQSKYLCKHCQIENMRNQRE